MVHHFASGVVMSKGNGINASLAGALREGKEAHLRQGYGGQRKPLMPNAFGITLNTRSNLSPELILKDYRMFDTLPQTGWQNLQHHFEHHLQHHQISIAISMEI